MAHVGRGNARVIVAVALVVLVAAGAVAFFVTRPPGGHDQRPKHATTAATTQADTQPATARAAKGPKPPPPPPTHYLEVVRAYHPRMPETQPLAVPLDLSQAARLTLAEPLYLSPRGDLWITRPDAAPTPAVLARAAKEQGNQLTLTTREQVLFAHWTPQEKGPWTFTLVVRGADGRDEVVTQSRRTPIADGRTYHWERAMDWGEKVVVATGTGVSVFYFQPELRELHHDLVDPKAQPDASFAEPQFLLDWEGLLAWVPWEGKKQGGRGAARFLNDKWLPLGPEQGWPDKLLHLVPLYDGGVLQLVPQEDEGVKLAFTSLEQVAIDEALVAQHVEKLSAPDEAEREAAFKELNRYGTSAWPILERMMNDQGPEAQARLRLLLKNRNEPTLGGFELLGNQLKVITRLADGGAVFYAEVGVSTAGEGVEPVIRSPAWVSVRPGQAVALLDEPFTVDFNPDRTRIWAFEDEWIVTNTALGPQRYVGNGFTPLLKRRELAFSDPVGIDRRGRWIFRKPRQPSSQPASAPSTGPDTAPTTTTGPATSQAATTTIADDAQFLILDPTLPDPTPRLPVWTYSTAETVGWDKDNWPAVKRVGAWALRGDDWGPMKRTEKMFTDPKELPPPPPPPRPATTSTAPTQPATTTTTATAPAEDLGPVLLVDADGKYYYDGRTRLVVIAPGGERVEWQLPPAATGSLATVHLARTQDGLLFLYNAPGRLLRIRPTPDEAEPFALEATFTRNIPNADAIARLWVDPAGRLIMAYGTKLGIMFPQGFIPPAIAAKMPPGQTEDDE